jgi:hypothetical protein
MASLEISDLEEHLCKAQKAATQARELADWAQEVADDALKHLSTRRTAAMRSESAAHSSSRGAHRSRTPGRSRSSSPSSGLHPLLKMVRDEVRQHDQPKQVGAYLMHINGSIEGLTAHRKPGAGSASRLVKAIKDIVGWETCLVFKGEDSDCIQDVAVCIK